MSGLTNFIHEEICGKEIWKYGKPGHPEVRAESHGKHGADDWKAILVAPPSLEVAPTMPAIVLVAGVMVVSQRLWPEHEAYDLDLAGYLEKAATAETITDAVLNAHACELNWQLHREHHGRGR